MTSGAQGQQAATVKRILADIKALKPMPTSAMQVLKLLEAPDVDVKELERLIATDQALTANLLHLANSAYFASSQPCTTVSAAIMRVGFKQLRSTLYSAVFSGTLSRRLAGYQLGPGELWRHSVAVAWASRWLGQQTRMNRHGPLGSQDLEELYIAGLLHDIGKLILNQYIRADYRALMEQMSREGKSLVEIEAATLGMDHATVGAEMAYRWQLPPRLADIIGNHHSPSLAQTAPHLAAMVQLADTLCLRLGIGLTPRIMPDIPEASLALIGLAPAQVETYAQALRGLMTIVTDFFNRTHGASWQKAVGD